MGSNRTTYADCQERDSLVDTAERRDIDGLTTDGTLRTNTSRIFTRAGVDDGINKDLERMITLEYETQFQGRGLQTWMGFWSVRRWMISNEWATIRTAMSFLPLLRPFIIKLCMSFIEYFHYGKYTVGDSPVDQTLDNGHLRLFELLLGVSSSGMWEVDGMANLDVIGQGDILYFNTT